MPGDVASPSLQLTFTARTLPLLRGEERQRLLALTILEDGASGSLFHRILSGELHDSNLALIAVVDEVWVGWALLWWTQGSGSNIGVYMAPEWRKKGIGLKLVRHLAAVASLLGLYPHANGTTPEAQRLFRLAGVRPYTPEYER